MTGSVFGNEPCLVSLDNYKNFPALNLHEGSVLKFRNTDQPGAVSGVLDILEKHKVRCLRCVAFGSGAIRWVVRWSYGGGGVLSSPSPTRTADQPTNQPTTPHLHP